MNPVQSWLLLLVFVALAMRGLDSLRFDRRDLYYGFAAFVLAVLQQSFHDQVSLDDRWFAPVLLALPVLAGARGGIRAGFVGGLAVWLVIALVSGAAPMNAPGDAPQNAIVLCTLFGAASGGLAGVLRTRRPLGAYFAPMLFLGYFGMREESLLTVGSMLAVPVLACGWAALLGLALAEVPVSAEG